VRDALLLPVALVRTKGPQRELNCDAGDEPPKSPDADKAGTEGECILDNSNPFDSAGTKRENRHAIEISQQLIGMYESGAISNAEDFFKELSKSPNIAATRHDTTRHDTTRHDTTRHDTTRHCLAHQGKHAFDVSASDFTFSIGGDPVFPQHLESEARFKVTLENIVDVNKDSVSARLISVSSGLENPCIRYFAKNKIFTVHIGTSHDALLIRHPGVSICDELQAEVTVTVDTSKGVVCGLTLIRMNRPGFCGGRLV
jgi:hypothetical protein